MIFEQKATRHLFGLWQPTELPPERLIVVGRPAAEAKGRLGYVSKDVTVGDRASNFDREFSPPKRCRKALSWSHSNCLLARFTILCSDVGEPKIGGSKVHGRWLSVSGNESNLYAKLKIDIKRGRRPRVFQFERDMERVVDHDRCAADGNVGAGLSITHFSGDNDRVFCRFRASSCCIQRPENQSKTSPTDERCQNAKADHCPCCYCHTALRGKIGAFAREAGKPILNHAQRRQKRESGRNHAREKGSAKKYRRNVVNLHAAPRSQFAAPALGFQEAKT